MRTKKLFLILALLAFGTTAWAQNFDVWDGHTTTQPSQISKHGGYYINSAAELAYIREHWDEGTRWYNSTDKEYRFCDIHYTLTTNIDMGNTSWVPLGTFEDATFYGEGHTIRINIDGATDNYQGLFAKIGSDATVRDLHIIGNVKCSDSRLVGGIAGQNDGTIKNCWVSADVSSDWKESASAYTAKVGGIAGENNGTIEYCCMTGNVTNNDADVGGIVGYNSGSGKINHVTFYGTRSSTHSQYNEYVGDQRGTLTNQHGSDLQNNGTLASYIASITDDEGMYKYAVQYPFSVSCRNVGAGTIVANPEKTRATQTVTLTWAQDMTLEEISVKTVDGNSISMSGNNTDGYSFSMPAQDVNVTAVFNTTDWDDEQKGTEDNPYIIDKTNEWNDFVTHVNNGNSYSGKYIKLTTDIDVTTMAGVVSGNQQVKPFSGIFDGGGHTITATISDIDNQGTALFKYINGATIKNLTVAGSVNGGLHAAAIVGFSKGTGNSIENCKATATVNGTSHIGGILGHGLDSHINITKCIFSGKLIGGSVEKGAIYGWGDNDGEATVNNCLYAMQDGQDETKLDVAQTHGGTVTVTDTYKSTTAGSYGWIVDTVEPLVIGLYAPIVGIDGNTYYLRIGSKSDNGNYVNYSTYADMTVKSRIIVKGPITLTLGEGTTLNAKKGIEVSYDKSAYLTINGPGDLNIDDCETYDAGIGAEKVGTLIINGGSITVKGGEYAAGIGCSYDRSSSGGHIIINGGVVTANGGSFSSGIGGSASSECNSAGNIEINGGQVKAFGHGAFGIGSGDAESSGTLKLGWTNPDDFVYIKSVNTNKKIASVTFVEGKQFYLEHTATIATTTNLYDYKLIPYTGTLPSLAGEGTENNPYLISSTDDWLLFGELINRDTDYSGKFVKLAEDISVTTWVGTREDHPFSGTFDGGRHTLTVNISQRQGGTGVNQQGVAPFHFIKNATIKNLTVDGDITSNKCHTSGLVGFASGTNLIEDCIVKAKLHVGQDYVGGIVGHGLTSTTTIKGCVFAGTVEGIILSTPGTNSRLNVGGIWGWNDSGSTPILINCLEYGTYNHVFSMHPIGLQGNAGTITNCYYLNPQVGTPTNACTVSGAKRAYAFTTAPANLGELEQDYGTIKVYPHGILYNGTYYMAFVTISLADNSDNSTTISNADGYLADVTLSGRTLYKDGAWNTLCLPFSVDNFTGTPLEGATVKTLASTDFSGGTLTMTFSKDVSSIEAGKPYIVKWAKPDGYTVDGGYDISEPVFNGVIISNATANVSTDYVDFVGTYRPVKIYTDEKTNLYLGAGNTLYYPTDDGFKVNACRGYFQLKPGLKAGDSADPNAGVRAFKLNFGDDDNATGILTTNFTNPTNSGNEWYSLDGRKLDGKPTRAGVYINNGKKVVIK